MTGGCATLETLQQFIQKPEVQFEGMSLESASLAEGNLLFKFKVTNPNPIGATIRNVAYDLRFNDKTFVKNVLNKSITLKANGSNMLELPVTVSYLDLFESVTAFIQSDKLVYDLSGSVGVGPFDIPYHTKGNLTVPTLPKVSLNKVEVSNLSFTKASMMFSLDVTNSNPFTVNLTGLDYNIKLGGKEFAQGIAGNISPITKHGKTTIEIPFNMNLLELGRSAYHLLTKSSSGYEVTGAMQFNLPKNRRKRIPVSKIWQSFF